MGYAGLYKHPVSKRDDITKDLHCLTKIRCEILITHCVFN